MITNRIAKQISWWKKYGILAPLGFAVGFLISYWLEWFHYDQWMIVAGFVFSFTAVVWWWWALFTILKLNNTLHKNVEQFLELLDIVKELNHAVKDSTPSNRQRRKPKADQNKSTKK